MADVWRTIQNGANVVAEDFIQALARSARCQLCQLPQADCASGFHLSIIDQNSVCIHSSTFRLFIPLRTGNCRIILQAVAVAS